MTTNLALDRDLALEHVDQVHAAREHLVDVYRIPADDRDKRLVAQLHNELGENLALARVHALLDVGAQLARVVSLLEAQRGATS